MSIFKQQIATLTVKPLRWESRIENVKVLQYETKEIHSVLIDTADNLNDPLSASEAESLADAISEFFFLISVIFVV